jgi:hypothetical protein
VPTIHFQLLHVFLVLAHDRRRVVHFSVTPQGTRYAQVSTRLRMLDSLLYDMAGIQAPHGGKCG